MSEKGSSEGAKTFSRRAFFKKAIGKAAEVAATGVVTGAVVNYLSQGPNPTADIASSNPTSAADTKSPAYESDLPQKTTEVPGSSEPKREINREAEKHNNAVLSMKKTLAYFPGLLDDNPDLKELIEDKVNSLNTRQFRIKDLPEHNAILYELSLDPNTPANARPDVVFLKQTNREGFDDMLSIEFYVNKSGQLIPHMKDAETDLTNDDLKKIISKMTQFAPNEWTDRNIFDEEQHKAVPHGVEGSNDLSHPRSYVQAQPNGHLMFILFTPPDTSTNQPESPGLIPRKGEVLVA